MDLPRVGTRQLGELLVGVAPSAILFGPVLYYLLRAFASELVPGVLQGQPLGTDWPGLVLLLLGPIGALALVSLALLIVQGPAYVARRGLLRVVVVGTGIPALAGAIWILALQALDPGTRPAGPQLMMPLALAGSILVGLRYLRFLPLLVTGSRQPRPSGQP